jgi:hypothetical protein
VGRIRTVVGDLALGAQLGEGLAGLTAARSRDLGQGVEEEGGEEDGD